MDVWLERHWKTINIFFAAIGVVCISYFFYFWLVSPSWVHSEFPELSLNFLLKPNDNLFADCANYIFNQNLGEHGYYRPRALSFAIQYFETNLSLQLFKKGVFTGIKLPSYAFSILATVAAYIWFWKSLYRNSRLGIAILGGASLLYYDIYINTSFMVLRGGKFLVTAACLICLSIFIRCLWQTSSSKSVVKYTVLSVVMFVLGTLDEQVIAYICLFGVAAAFISWKEKKVNQALWTFGWAIILYFSYYFFWGRLLFEHFTPGGLNPNPHSHQLYHAFRFAFNSWFRGIAILLANYVALGPSSILLGGLLVASLTRYFKSCKKNTRKTVVLLGLLLFPVIVTHAMLASHLKIWEIRELWYIFYLHASVITLFCSIPYAIKIARFKIHFMHSLLAVALIGVCLSGVYKIDSLYEAACSSKNHLLYESYCGDVSAFDGR